MGKSVLIVQPIHESGLELLQDFTVKIASDPSIETIKREIKGVHGLIVRDAKITRELIEAADVLQVIGRHGVGVDNIDVEVATKRGILVVNTLDANALSVAEHTLAAIGALGKRFLLMDKATRSGRWNVRNECQSIDIEGKTLGIIGMGRIGKLVAQKAAAAYNMKIVAFDPYFNPSPEDDIILCDNVDDIFRRADFVSVHTPITPETKNLVNADRIALMKKTAYLINFSRGGIVDEEALYQALKKKEIAGAALDVFVQEPPPNSHLLFELDNLLLTPHSAALTKECIVRMATGVAQGVADFLSGKRPKFPVNPEVL